MYTVILDEGLVLRDSDNVQVAPCDSDKDPNFVEYIQWVESGNEPTTIVTRPAND